MSKNEWAINISESDNGFLVSVSRNGDVVGTSNGLSKTFDEALALSKGIIGKKIAQIANKNKYAEHAKSIFSKTYLNGMFNGVHGCTVAYDDSGEAVIKVWLNKKNDKIMQIVPDVITDPSTGFKYNIKKVNQESPNVAY